MAFRINHVNKKTGVTYVYEAVSHWDPEKKQSRNVQKSIGKLDPVTGAFLPSKRLSREQCVILDKTATASVSIDGPSLLLDRVVSELGLDKVLKSAFPEDYKQILCMAYFIACRGDALCHCEAWSRNHAHPYHGVLASQRISEILLRMTEDSRQTFFSKWMKKVVEQDYLCYDITSVSSYAKQNEYVKYGYNRDKEKLRQINLAMLFGQGSRLPVYYQRLPGNITDVSTLHRFLATFKKLEMPGLHMVMDKGFYSDKNVDELLDARDRFMLAVPNRILWVQKAIDKVYETIQGPEGYRKVDGEVLYVHTGLRSWGKLRRRCYLHLYYNSHAHADDFDEFTEDLLEYKNELESGILVAEHKAAYEAYFLVTETPVRGRKVEYNNEAIQKHRNRYAGYLALLTNDIKDPVEALQVYRDKDVVEKSFDDLKNSLDMKRLRIHSSAAMDGRLFVQFVALIIMSSIRRSMRDKKLLEHYTVRELLEEMETLSKIRYSGKYGSVRSEATRPQLNIMKELGIELPA